MPLADSVTNPLINSNFAQKSEPVVMMAEGGIADLPMDQEPRPAIDPNAQMVFDSLRQNVSPREVSDELLATAAEADPQAVAEFKAALEELDVPDEILDLLDRLIDEILADPGNYEAIKEKYRAQGVTEDILPEKFDPELFGALNLAIDQLRGKPAAPMAPQEFAKGGIANLTPVAKAIAAQGRNGDTMLAHITPAEARMLKKRGGSGTINPRTGLPEFANIFSRIGNAIKKFAGSTVGKLVIGTALFMVAGPAAAQFLSITSPMAVAGVSGFVAGAGSTLLAGGNLRDALKAGAIGGITAGAIQGITGMGPGTPGAPSGAEAAPGAPGAPSAPAAPSAPTAPSSATPLSSTPLSQPLPTLPGAPTLPSAPPVTPPISVADPFAGARFAAPSAPSANILAPSVGQSIPAAAAPSAVPPVSRVAPPTTAGSAAVSGGTAAGQQAAAQTSVPGVGESIKRIGEGLGLGQGPADWTTFKQGVSDLFMPQGASQEAIDARVTELMNKNPKMPYSEALKRATNAMTPGVLRTYGPAAAAGLGIMGLAGGFEQKQVKSPYSDLFMGGPGSARDLMTKNPYLYYIQNLPGVNYYGGSVLPPAPAPAMPPPGYAHGGAVQHFEEGGDVISNDPAVISNTAVMSTPPIVGAAPVVTPSASQIGVPAARSAEVATPAAGGYNQFFPAAQNVFYGDLNRRLLSSIPSIDPNIGAATPEQKADYYNQLIGQGYTDPQIRAGVGLQTNADWAQLQQIAARRPAIAGGIGAFQAQPLMFPGQGELARLDAEYRKTMGDRPPPPEDYAYPSGPVIYGPNIATPTVPTRPTTLNVGTTSTTTKPTTPTTPPLSPAAKQLQGSFDTSIFNKTPQEKAAYYNSLLASGYDDATIRAAIGAPLDENWFKLREIAGQLKAGTTTATTATPVQALQATFDTSVFNKTPQEKAAYYNSLLGAGYDDATIRAAINAPLDANWLQLQQMAQGQRAASVAAPVAAPVPAPAPAVLREPMPGPAQSFEDTYEPPAVYAPAAVSPAPAPAPMSAPAPAPTPSPLEQLRASFDMSVFARTPQEKAAYYNSLLGQGYDDATIRAAIDAPLDENWRMLQQLAANQGVVRRAYGGGIASLGAGGYPRRTGQISGPGTEKSDSIPAMLSDGEFVMTAKAVRGAGKGDRRAGAKKMYALMHQLERNASRG